MTARDDVQEIGRGTVGRAIVSVGKLLEKMKKQVTKVRIVCDSAFSLLNEPINQSTYERSRF